MGEPSVRIGTARPDMAAKGQIRIQRPVPVTGLPCRSLLFEHKCLRAYALRSGGRPRRITGRKLAGQKPALKMKEVWSIRARLELRKRVRDSALFNVAIDSKLR